MISHATPSKQRPHRQWPGVVLPVVLAAALILSFGPASLAQTDRAVFGSHLRGGALVVGNPDYSSSYAVALWARNWCVDPPYMIAVYCSRTYDAGLSWSCPAVLYTSDIGGVPSPGRDDFSQFSADAVMDENGVVHLVMVLGRWVAGSPGPDPRTDVVYGQIPYETCELVHETLLRSRPLDATHGTGARPAICLGRQVAGRTSRYVHLVYADDPIVGYDTGEIRYTRSSDGGLTWDFVPPVDINWFSGFDTASPADICADGNGNVYVAYGPDWYSSSQPGAIYFRMSANDGATWDSNNTVVPGTGGAPALLCDDSNGVYIFYNFNPAAADRTDECTAYRWSTNNGTSWSSLVSVAPRYCGGHVSTPRIPVQWAAPDMFHIIVSDVIEPGAEAYEIFYVRMQTDGTIVVPRTMLSLVPEEGNNWDWGRTLVVWPDLLLVGCCQRFVWDWGDVALGEPYTMLLEPPEPPNPVEGAFYGSATESGSVLLQWRTESLAGIVGFNVYRATSVEGPFVRVNDELIAPTSSGEFEDVTVWPDTDFYYELKALLTDGTEDIVAGSPAKVTTSGRLVRRLLQPSPNPFTDASKMSFDVPDHVGPVRLVVYNAAGQVVRTLVDGPIERGRHQLSWDGIDDAGRSVSSGVYFVRLEVEGQSTTQKLIMLK